MPAPVITKPCVHCGKPFEQTKNNVKEWATLLYCSNACKRVENRQKRQAGEEIWIPPLLPTDKNGMPLWHVKKKRK